MGVAVLLTLALASPAPAQKREGGPRRRTFRKSEGADFIRQRDEWFYKQRAFPLDRIPAGARLRALEQLHQMLAAQKEHSAQPGSTAIAGPTWVPIGPQPTSSSFFQPFTSGRITALAVDPRDATGNTAYAGGAEGGVWKTTDGGATWSPLTDFQPSLAVGSIALDPNTNPSTIYVGTGEANFAADSYFGAGVLKSADGGMTWIQLGASVFAGPFAGTELEGGAHIGGLAVSRDGKTLLAAVEVFDVGNTDGIYRSTDGGMTWTNVLPGVSGTSVLFDPTNPNIAYAALGNFLGGSADGIYKSTNGGATWTKLTVAGATTNVGRVDLTIATSSPSTLYAAIEDSSSLFDSLLGVFKSTDGGTTWSGTNAPAFCIGQCFYDLVIRVSPTNPNLVFAGGSGPGFGGAATLVRSMDGGNTWTDVSNNIGSSTTGLHVDMHALAFSADGSRLYNGNDGGVWVTSPATPPNATAISWSNLNQGLGVTQFYPGLSMHPSNPAFRSYGGTQDNGTQMYLGNPTWVDIGLGCDGGYTAIDTNFPSTMYATCQFGFIAKSVRLADPGTLFEVDFGIDPNDPLAFIAPLVIDSSNPQRLYLGTCRVWQTLDGATTWAAISPDLTGSGGLDCSNARRVLTAVIVAPNASGTIYAGSQNSHVAVTTNGGTNWTDVSTGLPPRRVTDIAVDPLVSTTAYVAFSGFSGFVDRQGHVFQTIDGGSNWTDISTSSACVAPQGALPNTPVNDIVIDPDLPGVLYIATDIGVFQGSLQPSGGACWSPFGMTSLPHVVVLSLKLHRPSRTLFAASHGRSVWGLQLGGLPPFGLATISPASANMNDPPTPLSVTGNGFTSSSTVQFNGTSLTTSFLDANHLTAMIPAASLMAGAAVPVTVKDVGVSNALTFTVLIPAPTLNSLSPTTATAGASLSLIVNGSSFVNGTQVLLDGSGVPTAFNTATQVTATIPGSALAQAGTHGIDVFSPQPGGGFETNATLILNVVNPMPAATQLMPTNLNAGSAGFTLTVNGSAFVPSFPGQPGSTVQWNGSGRATTFVSPSQLTAAISVSDVAIPGIATVTVFNPAPGGGTSTPALTFTINQVGDFSFGTVSPSSATVPAGQSAMYTIPVIGTGGFMGSVTLSCAGLPTGAACMSIVPNPVPAGSSSVMTITTTRRSVVPRAPPARQRPWRIYGVGPLLAALFLLVLALRMKEAWRRRLAFGLTIGLVATFLALQIGCGGGGGGGGGGGTPAGPYTITIVGQSGSLNHATTVQLIVQ